MSTLANQYAKALYRAHREHPHKSTSLIEGLRAALHRRGHLRLSRRIALEYEKLELRERRVPKESAERERTRVLLDLYRHLTRHV
jgi:hypothetical protein